MKISSFLDSVNQKIKSLRQKKKEKQAQEKHKIVLEDLKKSKEKQIVEIDIPTKVIVKVVFIVALLFVVGELVVQLQSLLIISIVCFFVALGLAPILNSWEKHKIPRALAIIILYLLFLGGLTVFFFAIVPIFIEQITPLLQSISSFFGSNFVLNQQSQEIISQIESVPLQEIFQGDLGIIVEKLQGYVQSTVSTTFSILSGLFQGLFNLLYALVLLFFILLERQKLAHAFLAFFPKTQQIYIQEKTIKVQEKMSAWIRGQAVLMVVVGVAMYIGMKIFEYTLGMQYAAAIGLLAGFMEIFPYIGVFITGIFMVLVAYNISWTLVLAVILWMGLIQFLESNVLIPIVMEKVTGLSSVVVLLALSVGGVLGNAAGGIPLAILGMILAVPVAASIAILIEQYKTPLEKTSPAKD